jgi:hypothetical protein
MRFLSVVLFGFRSAGCLRFYGALYSQSLIQLLAGFAPSLDFGSDGNARKHGQNVASPITPESWQRRPQKPRPSSKRPRRLPSTACCLLGASPITAWTMEHSWRPRAAGNARSADDTRNPEPWETSHLSRTLGEELRTSLCMGTYPASAAISQTTTRIWRGGRQTPNKPNRQLPAVAIIRLLCLPRNRRNYPPVPTHGKSKIHQAGGISVTGRSHRLKPSLAAQNQAQKPFPCASRCVRHNTPDMPR